MKCIHWQTIHQFSLNNEVLFPNVRFRYFQKLLINHICWVEMKCFEEVCKIFGSGIRILFRKTIECAASMILKSANHKDDYWVYFDSLYKSLIFVGSFGWCASHSRGSHPLGQTTIFFAVCVCR